MTPAARKLWLTLLCALALVPGAVSSRAQAPTGKPPVSAALSFRCLWWSEQQMNGLNPNAPPPKQTEVILKKWEYSDPIGVPHPDVVDVVAELRNETAAPLERVSVKLVARWQVGPLRKRAKAVWGPSALAQPAVTIALAPQQAHTLRVPIKLAERMNKLHAVDRWPWALRIELTATTVNGKLLGKATATLPITPGD